MSRAELSAEPAVAIAPLATRDVEWQVRPEWRETLLGPDGLRWDEWRLAGRIQVVKQGAHRTVYRVDLPAQAFYLKHYHPQGWGAAAANRFRGSAARREERNAQEVIRRGLPTAAPIAVGDARGGRDSFFLTQAIENSCTLDEFALARWMELNAADRPCVRRRVMVALAELCAAAHRAGVEHADLHCGNVLVELETVTGTIGLTSAAGVASLPRLHWIDLPKMRFSAALSWQRSCGSLATLAAGWLHRTTRSERLRFWNAYLAARPDLALADPTQGAAEVIERARAHARRTLAGRDKRALATNRDFYRLADAHRVAHAVRDVSPADLIAWMREPERLSLPPDLWAVTANEDRPALRGKLALGGKLQAVTDRKLRKPSWKSLLLTSGEAFRDWRLAHALLARGISTPRPLCVLQPRRRWDRSYSYIVSEWIAGIPLDHFVSGLKDSTDGDQPETRRRCAQVVGGLLGQLHDWNATLPARGASATMISRGPDGLTAWLGALGGVRILRRLTDPQRARDLAQFSDSLIVHRVSRADRLRTLRSYLRALRLDTADWKKLWRSVEAESLLDDIAQQRKERQAGAKSRPA